MQYRYINISELNIDKISECVSKERVERAMKFKAPIDRKRSIGAEYLLREMLNDKLGISFNSLTYDDKGKPHIYDENGNDIIHFSLSHSGEYAACIISDKPCGIDIEIHSAKRDYEKIAKRICTKDELSLIDSREKFYKFWTLKESVLKALGLGLAFDMRSVKIKSSDKFGTEFVISANGNSYSGGVLFAPDGYSLSYVELSGEKVI